MRRVVSLIVLAVFVSAPATHFAQELDPAHELSRELHLIGERTGQAVSLLQKLLDQRSTEIELRRIQVAVLALQLRSNAIAEIEARVQTLQDRAAEAREYATQLDSEIKRIDDLLAAETTQEPERASLESSRDMVVRQIDLAQQRTWALERQVLDLENELAAKRRDVEALEEIVMDGLSGF